MQTKRVVIAVVDESGKQIKIVKITRYQRSETLDGDSWMELAPDFETIDGSTVKKQSDGSFVVVRSGDRYRQI
jgi:hypothetical protein